MADLGGTLRGKGGKFYGPKQSTVPEPSRYQAQVIRSRMDSQATRMNVLLVSV